MSFLYLLEGIRNSFLDSLMLVITTLGEETIFMVLGMFFFWCVDKYKGYYILITGFIGTLINQFLKITCRIERPWVRDPDFSPVGGSKGAATGYSFPSGHTQSAVGSFGAVARSTKNNTVRILCIAACVLVPFSRMYLGVHTPADVSVSAVTALALILLLYPLIEKARENRRVMWGIIAAASVIASGFLIFMLVYPFPKDVDADNLHSAMKNAYTLTGCMLGLIAVYYFDEYHTRFETKAVWWIQIIKVVGGIALVFAAKEGLRAPLDALFDGHLIARSLRYFIMVLVGGVLWPCTFKWFNKLERVKK